VDRTSLDELGRTSEEVERWFLDTSVPPHIMTAISDGYRSLCETAGMGDVVVAVRSSATAEDSEGASFAGEYETYVGVSGLGEVERHVRRCWASAFSARALLYAWKNGLSPRHVEMAVVVQKAVNAKAAGVMFTISPRTGDQSRIFIEASYQPVEKLRFQLTGSGLIVTANAAV
jgi:pyruvate, water dikinase